MFSLVTACMNREQHLRRSLREWITLPGLGEIVIVDWSNATPLFDLAKLDPRIRVVRVEGEERWILSYAYNVGISHATFELICKCDSDCLPTAVAVRHQPDANSFYAGYWKNGAAVGKPSVNGQCMFLKSQFERVNGYSEYIRTYGRDDEDYYDRLKVAGFQRNEIPPAEFNFIEHSQEDRIRNQFATPDQASPEQKIFRNTGYNEMRNYFLAVSLPWGPERQRAAFTEQESPMPGGVLLRRDREHELPIPAQLLEDAKLFSLRYLVGQLLKLPETAVKKLDQQSCVRLLVPRFAKIN